jgi:antitoxin StbD
MRKMQTLLTGLTVSMSDFKNNPAKVLRDADKRPVAVLNHNKAAFYMVAPEVFETLLDELEDARLAPIIKQREARGKFVKVNVKDL